MMLGTPRFRTTDFSKLLSRSFLPSLAWLIRGPPRGKSKRNANRRNFPRFKYPRSERTGGGVIQCLISSALGYRSFSYVAASSINRHDADTAARNAVQTCLPRILGARRENGEGSC